MFNKLIVACMPLVPRPIIHKISMRYIAGDHLADAIATTRTIRRYTDEPVTDEQLATVLWHASRGPSGSNRQGWQWVVVEDAARKQALADIYARNFQKYAGMAASNEYQPGDPRYDQKDKVTSSAVHLVENFHRVPLMMIPCISGEGRLDSGVPTFGQASAWGSLLPAVLRLILPSRSISDRS